MLYLEAANKRVSLSLESLTRRGDWGGKDPKSLLGELTNAHAGNAVLVCTAGSSTDATVVLISVEVEAVTIAQGQWQSAFSRADSGQAVLIGRTSVPTNTAIIGVSIQIQTLTVA